MHFNISLSQRIKNRTAQSPRAEKWSEIETSVCWGHSDRKTDGGRGGEEGGGCGMKKDRKKDKSID